MMKLSSAAIVLLAASAALNVHAAEADPGFDPLGPHVSVAVTPAVDVAQPRDALAQARNALFVHKRMQESALAEARGGALTVVQNDLTAKGTLTDNVASHLTTGTNMIDGNSFGNAAGLPMVIQNTGNNVLIQNSTILNLNLK